MLPQFVAEKGYEGLGVDDGAVGDASQNLELIFPAAA